MKKNLACLGYMGVSKNRGVFLLDAYLANGKTLNFLGLHMGVSNNRGVKPPQIIHF